MVPSEVHVEGKVALVLGATGIVGSGVVRRYLESGARVVGVSRSSDKLDALRVSLGEAGARFDGVVASFGDDAAAARAKRDVDEALAGAPLDHVVSNLGAVPVAKAPTETETAELSALLEEGVITNYRAARVFLPAMKATAGASFTLVSGGLAHFPPPMPGLWLATLKNASVNALSHGLASETAKDAVRVNTICIHFAVAPMGGTKNQLGMPAESDTRRLAPAFLGIARGTKKGEIMCLSSFADADALGAA